MSADGAPTDPVAPAAAQRQPSHAHGTAPQAWVLGARGMLGQAVVEQLRRRGHTFVATGAEVDVTSQAALLAAAQEHGAAIWFNCAAMTAVDACEQDAAAQARNQAVNAAAPGILGEVARARGARVVHVSTDYVFDGRADTPYSENAACAPETAYGRAKLVGEQNFWQGLGDAQAQGYVVRTSWLFGPHGNNFVTTMLKLMQQRETLQVVSDQKGRPTYTLDLAAAMLDLTGLGQAKDSAAAPQRAFGTYHFANAGATSWHGFAREILHLGRKAGQPVQCHTVHATSSAAFVRPAKRPAYSVFATEKIARALGQEPRAWQDGLREYLGRLPQPRATAKAHGVQPTAP